MDKIRLVSIFALLALLLSIGPNMAIAQEPPPADSATEGHLLVRSEDAAAFGDVIVTSPDHPLERGTTVIQGWEDARSTAIGVSSPKPGQYAAEIISSSYKFSSPRAAQAALAAALEARQDTLDTAMDGSSLLDERLARLLDTRSVTWRAWYWTDDVGLLNYGFILQTGSYVADIYIVTFSAIVAADLPDDPSASHEERVRQYLEALTSRIDGGLTFKQLVDAESGHSFGQRLLNHVIARLINEDTASASSSGQAAADLPSVLLLAPAPSPQWWTSARASHFIHQWGNGDPCSSWGTQEDCHHLATWDYPQGC